MFTPTTWQLAITWAGGRSASTPPHGKRHLGRDSDSAALVTFAVATRAAGDCDILNLRADGSARSEFTPQVLEPLWQGRRRR